MNSKAKIIQIVGHLNLGCRVSLLYVYYKKSGVTDY